METKYSTNRGNDEAFLEKLSKEYGLFNTGGSDFHGSNKPHIEIGVGMGDLRVPITFLENLRIN